jgi:hypothetical protein
LSYAAGPGEAIASRLAADLESRGKTCCLAHIVRADSESASQKALVHSACFLAIVTDHNSGTHLGKASLLTTTEKALQSFIHREDCMDELLWAAESGVTIQPIVLANDKGRIIDMLDDDGSVKLLDVLRASCFINMDMHNALEWKHGLMKVLSAREEVNRKNEEGRAASRWKESLKSLIMLRKRKTMSRVSVSPANMGAFDDDDDDGGNSDEETWDFFISFSSGQSKACGAIDTLAEKLSVSLEAKGFRCCTGNQLRKKSAANARKGLHNSACMLAIVSNDIRSGFGYFERAENLSEIYWAEEEEVAIQAIVTPEGNGSLGDLIEKAPENIARAMDLGTAIVLDTDDICAWKLGIAKLAELRRSLGEEDES